MKHMSESRYFVHSLCTLHIKCIKSVQIRIIQPVFLAEISPIFISEHKKRTDHLYGDRPTYIYITSSEDQAPDSLDIRLQLQCRHSSERGGCAEMQHDADYLHQALRLHGGTAGKKASPAA